MKRTVIVLATIIYIGTSGSVALATASVSAKIDNISASDGGTIGISLTPFDSAKFKCDANMPRITAKNSGYKGLLSMALTSVTLKKDVLVYFNETTPTCEIESISFNAK